MVASWLPNGWGEKARDLIQRLDCFRVGDTRLEIALRVIAVVMGLFCLIMSPLMAAQGTDEAFRNFKILITETIIWILYGITGFRLFFVLSLPIQVTLFLCLIVPKWFFTFGGAVVSGLSVLLLVWLRLHATDPAIADQEGLPVHDTYIMNPQNVDETQMIAVAQPLLSEN